MASWTGASADCKSYCASWKQVGGRKRASLSEQHKAMIELSLIRRLCLSIDNIILNISSFLKIEMPVMLSSSEEE
jgi:hypothetical protein